jgi:hypothetical protein
LVCLLPHPGTQGFLDSERVLCESRVSPGPLLDFISKGDTQGTQDSPFLSPFPPNSLFGKLATIVVRHTPPWDTWASLSSLFPPPIFACFSPSLAHQYISCFCDNAIQPQSSMTIIITVCRWTGLSFVTSKAPHLLSCMGQGTGANLKASCVSLVAGPHLELVAKTISWPLHVVWASLQHGD